MAATESALRRAEELAERVLPDRRAKKRMLVIVNPYATTVSDRLKNLVEYALHLPASAKIRRLKGKYLLRRLAGKYLPKPVVWRRKHGFIVPWEEWVRSPSNRLLDDLLAGGAWRRWDVFEGARLRWMLDELRAGSREVDSGLFFRVAVFALWLESFKSRAGKT